MKYISILSGFLAASTLFAWDSGPPLNTPPIYMDGGSYNATYLAADPANLSNATGFEGDLAVLLTTGGTGTYEFWTTAGGEIPFSGNVWLKLDSTSLSAKTSGITTIFGGPNNSTLNGNANIWIDGVNTPTGLNIYGSGNWSNATITGDLNFEISNSTTNDTVAVYRTGTVGGNVNFTINRGTIKGWFAALTSPGAIVMGDVNLYMKDSSTTYTSETTLLTGYENDTPPYVGGNLNVTFDGVSQKGSLRVGPNNAGGYTLPNAGRIIGNINVVLGGRYDEVSGTYIPGNITTTIGGTQDDYPYTKEAVLMTGGRGGSADGNTNLVIVDGIYSGTICMGPNSADLGTPDDPTSGNTHLTILGGTFEGKVFAGSHNKSPSAKDSILYGSALLEVSGGRFNSDIYVGAVNTGPTSYLNILKGDATAIFKGDFANLYFAANATLYAGDADGLTTLYFENASNEFSANIADFNKVVFDSTSYVNITGEVNVDEIEFQVDSLTQHGKFDLGSLRLDSNLYNVVVPNGFSPPDGSWIQVINITSSVTLTSANVTLTYPDGTPYAGLWTYTLGTGMKIYFGVDHVDEVDPAKITSTTVSGNNITLIATTDNDSGYYAIYSAVELLAGAPGSAATNKWSFTGVRGVLDANGDFTAIFPKNGDVQFYRVLISKSEFDATGTINPDTVYSKNVGGYYTVALPKSKVQYVCNQFDQPDQRASTLFGSLPNGAKITYTETNGSSNIAQKAAFGSSWANGNVLFPRGTVFQLIVPSSANLILSGTLEDEVTTRTLARNVDTFTCSALPIKGAPESFGVKLIAKLLVKQLDVNGGVQLTQSSSFAASWPTGAPVIGLGEGFRVIYPVTFTWKQNLRIFVANMQLGLSVTE